MSDRDPKWLRVTNRREARVLQGFTCTSDFSRTPGGRRLPHDRVWEWEAQRHLRQVSGLLRPGDLALVGTQRNDAVAAAHLQFEDSGDVLAVFIAAAGVSWSERRQGGGLADLMLKTIHDEGLARATSRGQAHLVLTGKIHASNTASQLMVQRAGWEPYDAPSVGYQSWGLIVPV